MEAALVTAGLGVAIFLSWAGKALYTLAKTRHRHRWAEFSEMTCSPRGRPEKLAGTLYGLRCKDCGEITQRYVGLQ